MAKDRRSRDQKRRDKLAKKARQSQNPRSLGLTGNTYKTDELAPLWMETEVGIYEAYVMTERKLLDQMVAAALETLVKQMRGGTLPPLSDASEIHYTQGEETDLVIGNIRRRWEEYFATKWRPSNDKCIGVLRTILGSIEIMRTPSPRSQSYMHHIAGFLTKKLGVSVQLVTDDLQPLPEPAEDELIVLGRRWVVDDDQDARVDFDEMTRDLLRGGQTERVIDACHQLMSEAPDPASTAVAALTQLSIQARQQLSASMG